MFLPWGDLWTTWADCGLAVTPLWTRLGLCSPSHPRTGIRNRLSVKAKRLPTHSPSGSRALSLLGPLPSWGPPEGRSCTMPTTMTCTGRQKAIPAYNGTRPKNPWVSLANGNAGSSPRFQNEAINTKHVSISLRTWPQGGGRKSKCQDFNNALPVVNTLLASCAKTIYTNFDGNLLHFMGEGSWASLVLDFHCFCWREKEQDLCAFCVGYEL